MEFLRKLFDTSGFTLRSISQGWSSELIWVHIIANILMCLACLIIVCSLGYILFKKKNIPGFGSLLFCTILCCAISYFVETYTFFHPIYRFSGLIKSFSSILSIITAISFIPIFHEFAKYSKVIKSNEQLKQEIFAYHKTENKLKEKKKLLISALENMGEEGVIVVDDKGKYIVFNSTAKNILGKNLTSKWNLENPEKEDPIDQNFISRSLNGETIKKRELSVQNNEDVKFHINLMIAPLRVENKIVGAAALIRNTTIRVQERKILLETKARLQSIFNAMPDAIIMANLNREIVFVNPAFSHLFGYTEKEVLQKKTQILYASEKEYLDQGKKRYNPNSNPNQATYKIKYAKKNQTIFTSESVGTPVLSEQGEHLGFLAIVKDITDKEDLKNELVTQKELLQLVLNSMGEGVIFANLAGDFLLINEAAQKLTGNIIEKSINNWSQNYGIFLSDTTTPFPNEKLPLFKAIQGEKSNNVEMFLKNEGLPNGIHLIVTGSPVKNKGKQEGGVIVFRNISERKKLELQWKMAKEDAERANRLKSLFLANMSHEIRTPMNGIIGVASLLMETALSEKQKEFVHIIKTSGESLLTIINDILDFSKIEAGKMDLELQDFHLTKCIEDVLDLLGHQAAKRKNDLFYRVDPSIPVYLYGDLTRVRQILVNLVNNAIKFTEQGEIIIDVSLKKQLEENIIIQLSVQDTGLGISEDKIANVFTPFYQEHSAGGTGLGLSISKKLTSMMQGNIWCHNNKTKGCSFSLL